MEAVGAYNVLQVGWITLKGDGVFAVEVGEAIPSVGRHGHVLCQGGLQREEFVQVLAQWSVGDFAA